MHIAVTGVSGFIGAEIARQLKAGGHTVAGLVRKTSNRDHLVGVVDRFVVGDHADASCWDELLDGADCVVHNSADWRAIAGNKMDFDQHLQSNVIGSLRLLKASAPRQFVFVSTIAVHHDMRERWGGVIDEDHPLRPGSDYGAYKAAVEAHLWAEHYSAGRNTSAVRPCGVYGVDPRLARSIGFPFIKAIKTGERFDRPGGGKFVHVKDVAAAIVAIVGNTDAAGRPFNLVDCYARWADWAKITGELLGIELDIDFSSSDKPTNEFDMAAAKSLGVDDPRFLNRGLDGIREHMRELIEVADRK